MNNRNNHIQQKILRMCERCELCGSMRNLEVHHIIPLVVEIEDIDLNCEENLIVVCKKCHALLTPHRLLTKIGQKKIQKKGCLEFYQAIEKETEKGFSVSVETILDLFDDIFMK